MITKKNLTLPFLKESVARNREQLDLMHKINTDGNCPFCESNFSKYHPKPIIRDCKFWLISENMTKYQNAKYHFLVVLKSSHQIEHGSLRSKEKLELFEIWEWLEREYDIPGSTLILRSGHWDYTGGSVSHLHAHIVSGSGDDNKPVMTRVG